MLKTGPGTLVLRKCSFLLLLRELLLLYYYRWNAYSLDRTDSSCKFSHLQACSCFKMFRLILFEEILHSFIQQILCVCACCTTTFTCQVRGTQQWIKQTQIPAFVEYVFKEEERNNKQNRSVHLYDTLHVLDGYKCYRENLNSPDW